MTDISEYSKWLLGQGLAANTIKQLTEFADRLLREWGDLDQPAYVIAEWLGQHTGWTKQTYFNHMRSLYRWLVETGQVEADPLASYRRPPTPAPRPKPLAAHQIEAVLEAATGDTRTWILLGLLAGLRSHEIAKFHGTDINETSIYVLGKGGQAAMLPTHPALWALAREYPGDDWWFASPQARREYVSKSHVENKIRALFRECGIDTGAVHRLRYSYGTNLSRAGVRTRVIQDLLRHASLVTTQRYLDVTDEERAAAIRTLAA